ncbi:hypothetical protein VitviT2T_000628 [Vitis vinifera]|uniref:DUF4283 domain-containing protein n=1 Tax=Vitis vinifera TaxID=29760 RepID=A0ABY9BD11_VITVI|nr:hypothetical protein VitviT2T_000628 [Vitis vinifera]WJZ80733.1 hypothetical protein VitviT2T_000628 [Vitis vinifera]
MKSFADVVKISPRRVGQSVWLEVGDREVRERIDQLRQCLVGWWGLNSAPVPELEYVRRWASQQWALKGILRVAMLGRGLLLFEFESSWEAERVLARGARNIKENVIVLNRWNPEVGCLCKDSSAKEVWVRVVGLPLHLWSPEIFKRIGDGCGGFVAIDDFLVSEMQWARILVKCVGREFPSSVQIVVGSGCYSLQLWWELPPGFSQVVPAGSLSGEGGVRGGEDDGGSQREKVEQGRVQQGWLDVSPSGDVPPVVISVAGTAVEGRVGSADGRVKGDMQAACNMLDGSVFGPCSEPNGAGIGVLQGLSFEGGNCQGPFIVPLKSMGHTARPIISFEELGCSEGEKGAGCGLDGLAAVVGEAISREGPLDSRPRASSSSLEAEEMGVADPLEPGDDLSRPRAQVRSMARGVSGDVDPLVGMSRDPKPPEVSEVGRGEMTDEALRVEASRYVDISSISVGGRVLSSSSLSSGFVRAGAKVAASSGLIALNEVEEQLPLSIILADGNIGVMDTEGEKSLGGDGGGGGGGGEFEVLLQELEERGDRWDDSCLVRFSKFLGFSTDGIEGEILNLLLRTKRRREQNIKKEISGATKFDRELKKLEWSVNYNGAKKKKSLVRVGGVRNSTIK